MKVAIIDYNAGNVQSVKFALERLGINGILTNDYKEILGADKVIFPGVGEANSTMIQLQKLGLDKVIPNLKQPVLGVCLGMQLMCSHSEENDTSCLNIIEQKVFRFQPTSKLVKVPHVGWNNISVKNNSWISKKNSEKYVYFVHSYFVEIGEFTIATTDYIQPFSAALKKDNFYATQFHPEKSADIGEKILKNFLDL